MRTKFTRHGMTRMQQRGFTARQVELIGAVGWLDGERSRAGRREIAAEITSIDAELRVVRRSMKASARRRDFLAWPMMRAHRTAPDVSTREALPQPSKLSAWQIRSMLESVPATAPPAMREAAAELFALLDQLRALDVRHCALVRERNELVRLHDKGGGTTVTGDDGRLITVYAPYRTRSGRHG